MGATGGQVGFQAEGLNLRKETQPVRVDFLECGGKRNATPRFPRRQFSPRLASALHTKAVSPLRSATAVHSLLP